MASDQIELKYSIHENFQVRSGMILPFTMFTFYYPEYSVVFFLLLGWMWKGSLYWPKD